MQTQGKTWWVLYVPPGAELKIKHELTVRKYETLVPVAIRRMRIRGKAVKRDCPLFPRYVFFGCENPPNWPEITELKPDPVRPVRFGAEYAQLAAADVRHLEQARPEDIPETNLHRALKSGMQVRITHGPMAGQAVVIRSITGQRAHVDVLLFGTKTPANVQLAALDAA